jgi:hypothetical protein
VNRVPPSNPLKWLLGGINGYVLFDPMHYGAVSHSTKAPKRRLYRDFCRIGWRAGHDPNTWFSTSEYLARYPDIASEGINPWLHFMRRGAHESRSWVWSNQEELSELTGPQTLSECLKDAAAQLVDVDYYLEVNPDVRILGLDAIEHYMRVGWKEGRAPNTWLNLEYLSNHAPVLLPEFGNPLLRVLELTTGQTKENSNLDSFFVDEMQAQEQLASFPRSGDVLIVVHAYYPEMLNEIGNHIEKLRGRAAILITTPEQGVQACLDWATESQWDATVIATVNRGRDWGPFIGLANHLVDLDYRGILKLHTKRSPHRKDGRHWFEHLLSGLLPSERGVNQVLKEFDNVDSGEQIFAANGTLSPIGDWLASSASVRSKDFARKLWPEDVSKIEYPAGSMFWMRKDVLLAFGNLEITPSDFEPELGQFDGTLSHFLERSVPLIGSPSAP